MANPAKEEKSFSIAPENKNDGLKLNTDEPTAINTKPRLNLSKKPVAQTEEAEKKQILLK